MLGKEPPLPLHRRGIIPPTAGEKFPSRGEVPEGRGGFRTSLFYATVCELFVAFIVQYLLLEKLPKSFD